MSIEVEDADETDSDSDVAGSGRYRLGRAIAQVPPSGTYMVRLEFCRAGEIDEWTLEMKVP